MNALFNITYGLYVLTAKDKDLYNGCITNTFIQVTSSPARVSIAVNKDNFTTAIIEKTGEFNVSILDNTATFDLFKHFGFQSGKNVDKFKDFKNYKLSKNGIPYITKSTNAYVSAKVIDKIDVGTHFVFIADVTDSEVLSNNQSVTYDFYHKNIKPSASVVSSKKFVYVCRICGYVYEGDEMPDDFICPICKHGKIDFEKKVLNENSEEKKMKTYYCPVCGYEVQAESNPGKCVLCGADMLEKV